jgi:hypothetical protein
MILTPVQSRLYSWLCTNIPQGDIIPTMTEISYEIDMPTSSVSNALIALRRCGLLSGEQSEHCSIWIYRLAVVNASYEVKLRKCGGVLDPWQDALRCGY